MFSKFLVALSAFSLLAYAGNFMLMEKNFDGFRQLYITQSSKQPPGCNEQKSAYPVSIDNVFGNRGDFSGYACGVELNFYQNNGNSHSLGWCETQDMSSGCKNSGSSHGVAWCQNYDQTKNGINPCV